MIFIRFLHILPSWNTFLIFFIIIYYPFLINFWKFVSIWVFSSFLSWDILCTLSASTYACWPLPLSCWNYQLYGSIFHVTYSTSSLKICILQIILQWTNSYWTWSNLISFFLSCYPWPFSWRKKKNL